MSSQESYRTWKRDCETDRQRWRNMREKECLRNKKGVSKCFKKRRERVYVCVKVCGASAREHSTLLREVLLYNWSPVLQFWIHFIQITTYYFLFWPVSVSLNWRPAVGTVILPSMLLSVLCLVLEMCEFK